MKWLIVLPAVVWLVAFAVFLLVLAAVSLSRPGERCRTVLYLLSPTVSIETEYDEDGELERVTMLVDDEAIS